MYQQVGQLANYQNQSVGQSNAINSPVPRTISSASSRLDTANERLSTVRDHLAKIADALGAIRAISGDKVLGEPTLSQGAVVRLNESADLSHRHIGEIESLLSAISNALG